jgi:hypothetical protein
MDAVSGPNVVMYESENGDTARIARKMLFRQPLFQSILFTAIIMAQSASANHGVVR